MKYRGEGGLVSPLPFQDSPKPTGHLVTTLLQKVSEGPVADSEAVTDSKTLVDPEPPAAPIGCRPSQEEFRFAPASASSPEPCGGIDLHHFQSRRIGELIPAPWAGTTAWTQGLLQEIGKDG